MKTLLVACFATLTVCGHGQTLISKEDTSNYVLLKIHLPERAFSQERLVRAANDTFAKYAAADLVKVEFFSRLQDSGPEPGSFHAPDVASWLKVRHEKLTRLGDYAEALRMKAGAVLRIRRASGTLQRLVLSGEDPTQIALPKIGTVKLLLLSIGPSATLAGSVDRTEVRAYVEAVSPITRQTAEATISYLTSLFGQDKNYIVSLRSDPWFATEVDFPSAFPLSDPSPKDSRFEEQDTLRCYWSLRHSLRCSSLKIGTK